MKSWAFCQVTGWSARQLSETKPRSAPCFRRCCQSAASFSRWGVALGSMWWRSRERCQNLIWQPSERDAKCLKSIRAWLAVEKLSNVRSPVQLDVGALPWPIDSAAALVCINMIHIAPWPATEALFQGSRSLLSGGGLLCLYGPFKRRGQHTSVSNEGFDALLRRQDPEWGVRDIDDVSRLADEAGLDLRQTHEMPSNNLTLVFAKTRIGWLREPAQWKRVGLDQPQCGSGRP